MAAWWTNLLPVLTLLLGWWLNHWASRKEQTRQRTWHREDLEDERELAASQAEIAALTEARAACIELHLTTGELLDRPAHPIEAWHRFSTASAGLHAALSLVDHKESRSALIVAGGAEAEALALVHDPEHEERELPKTRYSAFEEAMHASGARIRELQAPSGGRASRSGDDA